MLIYQPCWLRSPFLFYFYFIVFPLLKVYWYLLWYQRDCGLYYAFICLLFQVV